MNIQVDWFRDLEIEDIHFIKRFILSSGSLKEMSEIYGVTYPTMRLKLDRLIQKIQITENQNEDPYIIMIKNMAIDNKLDYEVAKKLIQAYRLRGENK